MYGVSEGMESAKRMESAKNVWSLQKTCGVREKCTEPANRMESAAMICIATCRALQYHTLARPRTRTRAHTNTHARCRCTPTLPHEI